MHIVVNVLYIFPTLALSVAAQWPMGKALDSRLREPGSNPVLPYKTLGKFISR